MAYVRNGRTECSDGAVIWVTGLPNSGKTTVAREICRELTDVGLTPVHLDGDVLRALFGNRWGYSEDERRDLASTYTRLAETLAEQNIIAVVSVVAMFSFVYQTNRLTIKNYTEVYLQAPLNERLLRDSRTNKNTYKKKDYTDDIYTRPPSPDIVIENYGVLSPADSAKIVCSHFFAKVADPVRHAAFS